MADAGSNEDETVLRTPSLSVLAQVEDGNLLARVIGRLDGQNAPIFRQALESLPLKGLRSCPIDMEGLNYIASVGLRVLLGFRRLLSAGACKFSLCSLPETIKPVFEISGFDRVITIYPNAEVANQAAGS